MSAELVALDAEPPGEGIVALLEEVLVKARAGELSSVGIAIVYRDGSVEAIWSKPPSIGLLIGAVGRLMHRLHLRADGL